MKKILLFCNGELGVRIARYIVSNSDLKLIAVVVNDQSKRSPNLLSELGLITTDVNLFVYTTSLWEDLEFKKTIRESNIAISALFGHRIPASVIRFFGTNIYNLHPSLLPIGGGADPVAWAIIQGQKQGSTIHILTEELDKGSIVLQTELSTDISMSSALVYQMAIDELFNLLTQLLSSWPEHPQPTIQEGISSYHKSADLLRIRLELLHGNHELESSIRLIQALTYSDERKTRARFQDGTIWDISVTLRQMNSEDS